MSTRTLSLALIAMGMVGLGFSVEYSGWVLFAGLMVLPWE